MTNSTDTLRQQLQNLAAYLSQHREALLDAWRARVEGDAKLQDVSQWTRARFHDHIPFVLDAFADELKSWPLAETPEQEERQREAAEAHSRHRWQQGYELQSLVREWGHLNGCVIRALHDFVAQNSKAERAVSAELLSVAHDLWAQLLNDCVAENVVEYYHLLQSEAATRARELEQALGHVRALDEERGQVLRSAAHDLKGSLSVVMSSASLMDERYLARLSPDERAQLQQLFQQGFGSLNQMLGDLMDMARLEAGQENRHVAPFDAAQLLQVLCENLQPLARERGLYLRAQGPATLLVEGDAVKVQRIAQNLLLNSLKYTEQGGVELVWSQSEHAQAMWELCVEDTGPGLESSPTAPLAQSLEDATRAAHEAQDEATTEMSPPEPTLEPKTPTPSRSASRAGEGIGLAIVKRLCELLNASIELQTLPGVGSTFRIVFPQSYES